MREGLPQTGKATQDVIKRVKETGKKEELQEKLEKNWEAKGDGQIESPFSMGIEYLAEHFRRQADGLMQLGKINDTDAKNKLSLNLLLRRKEMLNSLNAVLDTKKMTHHSFTKEEGELLRWFYDLGSAFVSQISKTMGLFGTLHHMSAKESAVPSMITAAELQQNLAQIIIMNAETPTELGEGANAARTKLEELAFTLLNNMAINAMGMNQGGSLYNNTRNGAYGAAAAYFIYSDPRFKENRFRKSFKVLFTSPYVDATDATDLYLIDDAEIPDVVREEITKALQKSNAGGSGNDSIDALSLAAKKFVYKVQVKSRFNGGEDLTSEEKTERDRFISARCTSRGFPIDNGEYLVLTKDRAADIIRNVRNPKRG